MHGEGDSPSQLACSQLYCGSKKHVSTFPARVLSFLFAACVPRIGLPPQIIRGVSLRIIASSQRNTSTQHTTTYHQSADDDLRRLDDLERYVPALQAQQRRRGKTMEDGLAAMEDGLAASRPPAISCRVLRARKSVNGGAEAECNGSVAQFI